MLHAGVVWGGVGWLSHCLSLFPPLTIALFCGSLLPSKRHTHSHIHPNLSTHPEDEENNGGGCHTRGHPGGGG